MAINIAIPTWTELERIDQNFLPQLVQNNPIFDLFPIRNRNSPFLLWEQRDDWMGLMQSRGYDGAPPSVPPSGFKRRMMQPGVYGEFDVVSELEITTRAAPGTVDSPIAIDDLVMERKEKLATRSVNRMSWVLWTLITTGVYQVLDVKGAVVQQDSYIPQLFTASVTWATTATATPLADLRAVQLLHRGISVSFGSNAKVFMNQKTFNNLIANTNANDLGGRRGTGLSSIEGVGQLNELLTKDNLPNVVVYDEGYKNDAGTFSPWIPDAKFVVVGRRTNGAAIGEFSVTRNLNRRDGSAGSYTKVIDRGARDDEAPPRRIEVHQGWNGGPSIWYAGSVVVGSV